MMEKDQAEQAEQEEQTQDQKPEKKTTTPRNSSGEAEPVWARELRNQLSDLPNQIAKLLNPKEEAQERPASVPVPPEPPQPQEEEQEEQTQEGPLDRFLKWFL